MTSNRRSVPNLSWVRLYAWWRWQQIKCRVRGHVFGVHGDGDGHDWLCCENCGEQRDL